VVLGDCKIDGLPANLPEGSKVDVTISYDPQARVHVSAKDAASGKSATTEILRQENIVAQLTTDPRLSSDSVVLADKIPANPFKQPPEVAEEPQTDLSDEKWTAFFEKKASGPVALCNDCGTPLGADGKCPQCSAKAGSIKTSLIKSSPGKAAAPKPSSAQPVPAASKSKPSKPASPETIKTQKSPAPKPAASPQRSQQNQPASPHEEGEDDFWKFVGE
jgi:molecular chaperone DnaK